MTTAKRSASTRTTSHTRCSCTDENVRVPYVIAAPGLIRDPIRVERVTSTIDTTPTILDLLGYAPSTEHQGASLLKPAPRQAFFYTDYSLGWLGLRDSCWKYLYETDSGRSKLFDLCSDPDEIRDRAGDFESRVLAYRDRVRRWAAAQKTAVQSGGRLTTTRSRSFPATLTRAWLARRGESGDRRFQAT